MDKTLLTDLSDRQVYWQSEGLICQWLATLYSAEMDSATLEQYRAGAAEPLLQLMQQEHQLQQETRGLRQAISGWVMLAQPRLELAADFASLFLTDSRSGAPPYASLYSADSGRFNGDACQRMQARLQQLGCQVKRDMAEPPDHLAVMLDYLATCCRQLAQAGDETEAAQKPQAECAETSPVLSSQQAVADFIRQELLGWLALFSARCQQVTVVSDFYPALARLTLAYLTRLAAADKAQTD